MIARALLLSGIAIVLAGPLSAQRRMQFAVWGTVAQQIVNSRVGDTHERLSGTILGAEGTLTSERLVLRLRYGEGTVGPRQLAEGEALVGYRAAPWLTLWAGPNARAYVAGDTDQRWLFWSGRATLSGTILPGRVQSFVELWKSASGSVTRPDGSASGRGAEAGLDMRLSGQSVWGRLAYRIEQGLADAALRETVETLALSIAYAPQR